MLRSGQERKSAHYIPIFINKIRYFYPFIIAYIDSDGRIVFNIIDFQSFPFIQQVNGGNLIAGNGFIRRFDWKFNHGHSSVGGGISDFRFERNTLIFYQLIQRVVGGNTNESDIIFGIPREHTGTDVKKLSGIAMRLDGGDTGGTVYAKFFGIFFVYSNGFLTKL